MYTHTYLYHKMSLYSIGTVKSIAIAFCNEWKRILIKKTLTINKTLG